MSDTEKEFSPESAALNTNAASVADALERGLNLPDELRDRLLRALTTSEGGVSPVVQESRASKSEEAEAAGGEIDPIWERWPGGGERRSDEEKREVDRYVGELVQGGGLSEFNMHFKIPGASTDYVTYSICHDQSRGDLSTLADKIVQRLPKELQEVAGVNSYADTDTLQIFDHPAEEGTAVITGMFNAPWRDQAGRATHTIVTMFIRKDTAFFRGLSAGKASSDVIGHVIRNTGAHLDERAFPMLDVNLSPEFIKDFPHKRILAYHTDQGAPQSVPTVVDAPTDQAFARNINIHKIGGRQGAGIVASIRARSADAEQSLQAFLARSLPRYQESTSDKR